MRSRYLSLLLTFCWLPALTAQTTNLRVSVVAGSGSVTVAEGTTVPVFSDGRESNAAITITNGGTAAVVVNQVNVAGLDFSVLSSPPSPFTLSPSSTAVVNVRYRPVSGRSSIGQVGIVYTEAAVTRSLNFTLAGMTAEISFFLVSADGRRTAVVPGSRLVFSRTRLGAMETQTLLVANRGSAPGLLNSISVSGGDFAIGLSGSASLPAGQEVGIPVTFSPRVRGQITGTLTLDISTGVASFNLEGTGAAPAYAVGYALRPSGNSQALTDGGRLTFSATAATTTSIAEVIIENQGSAPGLVRSVSLTGNSFQLAALPLLPAALDPAQAMRFQVQFTPRQLGNYQGTLRIQLDDRTITATVDGSTSLPDLTLSYIDPVTRNIVAVSPGGAVTFPSTPLSGGTTYSVILTNIGEGTGFVNAISIIGDAFQLVDVPALPATLLPAGELRFGLRFAPRRRDFHAGFLRIEFPGGARVASVSGVGVGPALAYTASDETGNQVVLAPGVEFALDSALGQTASSVIRITNIGTSEAQIATISITGTSFQIINAPFLPLAIAVGAAQSFTLSFTPSQPGIVRGRLRIGEQDFDLTGTGLGPRLVFSYANQAGTVPLGETDPVVLTSTRVGETSVVSFSVLNSGTRAIAISTIDVNPASAVLTVENAPRLPANLSAGGSLAFGLRFAPNNVVNTLASLRINSTSIPIVGTGQQPVPIPEHRIEGPTGVQPPMQQPALGLSLAAPYGLPLRGTLNLSFASEVFSENPAVQFATGGRTSAFVIPANSTRAIFDNGGSEVRVQTGTVAGTIQIKPAFTTQAGLDVTPESVSIGSISISRTAPKILTVEVASRAGNSVVLLVTGYSTTRSLRQVDVRLTPRGDQKLTSMAFSVNIESASLVWFQSTPSQSLGGLFSVTIPINLQQSGSTDDLTQYLQSVTVTTTNEVGPSAPVDALL